MKDYIGYSFELTNFTFATSSIGSMIPCGKLGAEHTSIAVFLVMALFMACEQIQCNKCQPCETLQMLPFTVCKTRLQYLHINFHCLLVQRYVNKLHPKVVCCFVKCSMDTDWCNATA